MTFRVQPVRNGLAMMSILVLHAAQTLAQPPAQTFASGWSDPVDTPAEMMPLASASLLTALARSGSHYVAAGSRGDILLSDDASTWRQVGVPTQATITAIAAIDTQLWAVGHDGIILHSADSGEHWQVQRKDPWKPGAGGGAGAPLLGVLFLDAQRGFAVGAYSLALKTIDGGATWLPMTVAAKPAAGAGDDDAIEDEPAKPAKGGKQNLDDRQTFSSAELKLAQEPTPHLNAIARTGSGALFIVGERGSAFRSRDDGNSWQRLQLPYDGSMFGVLGYADNHVLAFGLRGHVYESNDLGDHWTAVATATELSLMGGAALAHGGAVIVGANGIVLSRRSEGDALTSEVDEPAGIIATVLPLVDGHGYLLAGENGVLKFAPK